MIFSVTFQSVGRLFIFEKLFAFWKKIMYCWTYRNILIFIFQINNEYKVYRTLLIKDLPSDHKLIKTRIWVYILSFTNEVVMLVTWFCPPHVVFSRDNNNNTVSIGWRVIVSGIPFVEIKVSSVVPVNVLYTKPKRIYQGR